MNGLRLIASGHTPALRATVLGGDHDLDEGGHRAALALRTAPQLLTRLFPDSPWLVAPSRAAHHTAATLTDTSLTEEPALADPDYGTWTGHPLDRINPADLQSWLTDPTAAPHGGESLTDITARAGAWLDTHTAGKFTVVAHPIIIRTLIAAALELPATGSRRLAVAPLSVTRLTHHGHWSVHFPTP
ncbi:histidine phosphatase family protein [Actinoplanes sp. NEAU-A12]|uniref:Histidine phosphatase family protein n=1 Tax=Actinoplanes sandaracinus TaxID=3045177 RepID=A0ABT6WVK3_9ACTN|nr:histidine phosphatase family protein [Actinoplanes sandaracinus]MDI6103777.1 histidine phosphatase family protein [Actinoplanes sandaracinus]